MSLSAYSGSFAITNTSSLAITGVGFQPKVIIFWTVGGRSDGSNAIGHEDDYSMFGVAADTSHRWCISRFALDNGSGGTHVFSFGLTSACVAFASSTNGTSGIGFDLASFDVDGFTLTRTVNNSPATLPVVQFLALGGSDITNAWAGTKTLANSTGSDAFTGIGFKPDLVILGTNDTGTSTSSNFGTNGFGIGFSNGVDTDQVVWMGQSGQGANNRGKHYSQAGECLAGGIYGSAEVVPTLQYRASLTSMDSDGFTFNQLANGGGSAVFFALAIQGCQTKIGNFTTETDTTTQMGPTGLASTPAAVFFASALDTAPSAGTVQNDDAMSLGAMVDATHRNCSGHRETDATSPCFQDSAIEYDACYVNLTGGSSPSVQGEMDFASVTSGSFKTIMTTADVANNVVNYLAFLGAAGGGGGGAAPVTICFME